MHPTRFSDSQSTVHCCRASLRNSLRSEKSQNIVCGLQNVIRKLRWKTKLFLVTSRSKCIWHPWSNILRPHAGREVFGGVLGPRAVDAELEEAVEVARWKAVHLVCLSLWRKGLFPRTYHKYSVAQFVFICLSQYIRIQDPLGRTYEQTLRSFTLTNLSKSRPST